MKKFTAGLTILFFLLESGFFLPQLGSEVRNSLSGTLLAKHKDKKKKETKEIEDKEEALKNKEQVLQQREELLKKKEEALNARELQLKKRVRPRRGNRGTAPPAGIPLLDPKTSGPIAPPYSQPSGVTPPGTPK